MDSDNEEQLFSAIKCGVSACLTKNIDPTDLVNIVRQVAQDDYPISEALLRPGIASRVIGEFETFSLISKEVNNLLARLSPGESEILRHIANESSAEQVTQALGISEQAIRQQLGGILGKLVANNHDREVIEAAQMRVPMITTHKTAIDYITREEFTEFKESLMERFKSFSGELG